MVSGNHRIFDGIIVGAGHNGLVTAAYLSACGLRVAVFESLATAGGAMCTVASPAGSLHNLHAVHLKFHLGPIYRDLRLKEYGATLLFPEVKVASLYEDGSALVWYADTGATRASIARLSPRDAEVFERESKSWHRWNRRFVIPEIYNSPEAPSVRDARLSQDSDAREYLAVTGMSPRDYVTTLFKDPRVGAVVLWALTAQGYMVDYPGISPVALFTAFSALTAPMAICAGGSWEISKALKRFIVHHGGAVFESRPVRKIIVSGDTATGVQLQDMEEVQARLFVASGVNTQITFFDLIDELLLPKRLTDTLNGVKPDEWTIFGVHLALSEPPRHLAGIEQPDVDRALKYLLQGDPEEAASAHTLIRQGQLRSTPQMGAGCLSRHDPKLAANGCHSAYLWEMVPFRLANQRFGGWANFAEARKECCVDRWRRYAPNLTKENIVTMFTYSPSDVASHMPNLRCGGLNAGAGIMPEQSGWLRPTADLANYRTPIGRLYICGADCHPGGGAHGAPGYNAANVIAQDLGLRPWWQPIRLH